MLCDPFALPMSHKADPLRASIYIPLNVTAPRDNNSSSSSGGGGNSSSSHPQRLLLLQEAIVRHFGFVPCSPDPASPSANASSSPLQFIHTSGSVFVLILNPDAAAATALVAGSHASSQVPPSPQRIHRSSSNWLPPFSSSSAMSNGPATVTATTTTTTTTELTRHVVNRHKWQQNQKVRIGFLWAWNSMLSKRWKNPSAAAGDEVTPTKLLADFRQFCSDESGDGFGRLGPFHNRF